MIRPSMLRSHGACVPLSLALFLFAFTPSCKLWNTAANAPGKVASNVLGGSKKSEPVPPNVIQVGVMRFADTFVTRIADATQSFAKAAATPEAEIQGMSWAVGQSTAALTIASGGNPHTNLLDMVVLVTLGRMVHEEYWMPKVWGEADRPMVAAYASLEPEIWNVADQVLTPEHRDELRAVLREWRDQNPDVGSTAFVRLPTFEDILKARTEPSTKKGGGLGDLLSVDPLSGLEPAVREIEQTRLFAERTLFYLQRMALVLPVQVQLLSLQLSRQPEIRSVIEDSERISQAAASVARTAETLADAVRAEREAAVKQISDELTVQREGLVRDLEAARASVGPVLSEARGALDAGAQMSTALDGAIQSLDTFVGRFDKKDEPEGAPAAVASAPSPVQGASATEPSKPFDVTEYERAMARVGDAARELTVLVTTLDKSLPETQRLLDEVAARGDRTVDHAFQRALWLGSLLIAVTAITVLLVRWISRRWLAPRHGRAAA